MSRSTAVRLLLAITIQLCCAIEALHHRQRRQAHFTCQQSETKVTAPLEYEEGTSCSEVIARPPDRYKEVYRQTCQRWLGLDDLPHSVADTYVDKCYEYTNGSVRYQSSVCCFGSTSAQRCFTCSQAANTYECTYGGQVITCPAGQVCMTQSKDYRHNTYSKGYRYAKCAAANVCSALQGNNSQTCSSPVIGSPPLCTYCCTGPFCNYLLDDKYLWFYDDACKSHPCWNGGTCVLNSTTSGGYYCLCPSGYTGYQCQTNTNTLTCYNGGVLAYDDDDPICYCPISKTGKQCELTATICPSSANYPCYNGGTCYNHTASGSGFRCLCADGWVGAHCEQEAKLTCKSENGYYKMPYRYYTYGSYYFSINCTYRKTYVEKYYAPYYISYCRNEMHRSGVDYFEEGVHGSVNTLEAISLYQCQIGEGYMRYRYHMCCPSCYSNPCMNGGWCEQNSEWDYVCQCRYGYEGRNCENRINMCIISGDPHYKTIDGKQIHFQGPCKYNLLSRSQANNGLPEFSIYGKNERRGSNTQVTYPSYFEIHYTGHVIKLKRDGDVTVDDSIVYPDHSWPGFKITKNGRFFRFESVEGLVVEYDGIWVGLIKVPESFREKVDGLCGNYDGNAENDLLTSGKVANKSHSEIGNSWQVADSDDPHCTGPITDDPPDCDSDTLNLVRSINYCGLLRDQSGVFAACLRKSGELANSFYESCEYDVCANQANLTVAKEAACAILGTFAAHCQSIAVPVLWRTAASCPVTCPQGMVFKEKTSACAATCEVPDGPEKCAYPETENCVCPDDDMVVINGTCQKPEMCTCPGGRSVGSSWLSIDCKVRYECEPCKECPKRKVARVYGYQHTCASNEVCVKVGDVGKCQTCPVDGSWGPWLEWSNCNSATRRRSRSRKCDHPAPQCGGTFCPGSDEDTDKCFIVPNYAIIPETPWCDKDFDFQRACDECDLYRNPNMFVANPCSCATYYQCRRNQFFGYYYDVYERPCDPCTCWNQDKLTCDHDPEEKNPNHENCTLHPVIPSNVSYHGLYCYVDGRRFKAIPSNPHKYIDRDAGDIEMPCPPGTVFNVIACHCIHGPPVTVKRKPLMCLNFNDRMHPLKTEQGIYVSWTQWDTISYLEAGVDGTALRFDGDRLEIPYFNNKEIKKLTVSLWYRRDSVLPQQQTLVSYGYCNDSFPPSILIDTGSNSLHSAFKTTGGHFSTPSTLNQWHHVVVTYDSHETKLYLDGQPKGSSPSSGPIQYVHCPMVIGSQYDNSYFYGLMDEICFYEDVLDSSDVKTLYDTHSLN